MKRDGVEIVDGKKVWNSLYIFNENIVVYIFK